MSLKIQNFFPQKMIVVEGHELCVDELKQALLKNLKLWHVPYRLLLIFEKIPVHTVAQLEQCLTFFKGFFFK